MGFLLLFEDRKQFILGRVSAFMSDPKNRTTLGGQLSIGHKDMWTPEEKIGLRGLMTSAFVDPAKFAEQIQYYAAKLVDILFSADPDPKGRHVEWMFNQLVKQSYRLEDLPSLNTNLQLFMDVKRMNLLKGPQAQIQNYPTLAAFRRKMRLFKKDESGIIYSIDDEEQAKAETVFHVDTPAYTIMTPKTQFAAQFWGRETDWCTAWGAYGNTQTCMFPDYNAKGPLYVVIIHETDEMYQFHFDDDPPQFMNVEDVGINIEQFWKNHPDIYKDFLKIRNVVEDAPLPVGPNYLPLSPTTYLEFRKNHLDPIMDQRVPKAVVMMGPSAGLNQTGALHSKFFGRHTVGTMGFDKAGVYKSGDAMRLLEQYPAWRDRIAPDLAAWLNSLGLKGADRTDVSYYNLSHFHRMGLCWDEASGQFKALSTGEFEIFEGDYYAKKIYRLPRSGGSLTYVVEFYPTNADDGIEYVWFRLDNRGELFIDKGAYGKPNEDFKWVLRLLLDMRANAGLKPGVNIHIDYTSSGAEYGGMSSPLPISRHDMPQMLRLFPLFFPGKTLLANGVNSDIVMQALTNRNYGPDGNGIKIEMPDEDPRYVVQKLTFGNLDNFVNEFDDSFPLRDAMDIIGDPHMYITDEPGILDTTDTSEESILLINLIEFGSDAFLQKLIEFSNGSWSHLQRMFPDEEMGDHDTSPEALARYLYNLTSNSYGEILVRAARRKVVRQLRPVVEEAFKRPNFPLFALNGSNPVRAYDPLASYVLALTASEAIKYIRDAHTAFEPNFDFSQHTNGRELGPIFKIESSATRMFKEFVADLEKNGIDPSDPDFTAIRADFEQTMTKRIDVWTAK